MIARLTRSSLLEVMHHDYIRTARAKGLREIAVISHHALKNALIPVVTIMAIQVAGLLSGAVITEAVFGIPGDRTAVGQRHPGPRHAAAAGIRAVRDGAGDPRQSGGRYSLFHPRSPGALPFGQGQELSLSPTALTEPVALEEIRAASLLRDAVAAFRRNHLAMAGLLFVLLLALLAIFAPLVSPYNPYIVDLDNSLLPPSLHHWLGTDNFGRDVLTRILYGARISLVVGLVPSFIALVIGTAMGILSGYVGGRTDFVVMRLADMMIAFPSLLLAMVVMYTLGANLFNIFIALALVGWAGVARVVRAQTLALKEKEFIEAARANGTSRLTIMGHHIFPNVVPTLIVLFSLSIPDAIMWELSLSFLGVGVQPPDSSWGLLVSAGKDYLFQAPMVAVAPGVAILIAVLAFNFVGDGLRDALDPSMKG